MAGPKVVLWRPMYNQIGHGLLTGGGARVVVVDSPDPDAVIAELGDARALWVRTPERVTPRMIDAAPELVCISTSGFGTDNIPIDAATQKGILCFNHLGFGRTPVAEHSLMFMLAVLKSLMWCDRSARDGSAWAVRTGQPVYELEGRTVGLLGLGYIGSDLAKKLRYGFNCRVLAYDPYVNARLVHAAGVELVKELPDLLRQSQVLCFAAELTHETRDMIGEKELRMLPKDAVVVNAARGAMLKIDDLVTVLDSGHLLGAGIDVTFPEPLPADHPLLKHPRVILSPHMAGITVEATERLAGSAADQIFTALRGELPPFALNREAWEGKASRRPPKQNTKRENQ